MEPLADTILVTGGCGFLGSHIVDAFVAEGHFRVVVVSRNPTKNCNPSAEYIACDLTDHSKIAAVIEQRKPIAIVHASTPGPFAPAISQLQDSAATRNLIELAAEAPFVKAFILSGSAESMSNVSGARSEPLSESEAVLHTLETAPSAYASTKAQADRLVLQSHGAALSTCVLRLPGLYGPRDTIFAPVLLKSANTLTTRIQLGHNTVLHDYLYVESAANAHVLAAKALLDPTPALSAGGEAFFITDDEPVKFWDFARRVWTLAGDQSCNRTENVIIVPWWVVMTMAAATEVLFRVFTGGRKAPPISRLHMHYMKEGAWFSIAKARERLGYVPLLQVDEALQKTVAWFQKTPASSSGKKD